MISHALLDMVIRTRFPRFLEICRRLSEDDRHQLASNYQLPIVAEYQRVIQKEKPA